MWLVPREEGGGGRRKAHLNVALSEDHMSRAAFHWAEGEGGQPQRATGFDVLKWSSKIRTKSSKETQINQSQMRMWLSELA